jgi:hypothetical protein
MKASDRCRSTCQGARCDKARGHESALAMKPDLIHRSEHIAWNEKGEITERRYKPAAGFKKMLRSMDKFLAEDPEEMVKRMGSEKARAALDQIQQFAKKE